MRPRGRKSAAQQARYEAQIRKAHKMHATGSPVAEVARRFGYGDASSLATVFRRRGLKVYHWERAPWLPKWDQELKRHVARGGTFGAFADARGIRRQRVGQRAKELGIERPESPIKHGTASGYRHRKCRCDKCKEWNRRNRERAVDRRWGTPPKTHGYAGYQFNGCRCEVCCGAARRSNQRQYLRRKEKASA